MSLEIHDYLAFTDSPKGGNPAAVVFGAEDYSSERLQALAASIGAPATAFVLPSRRATYRLRFFTPEIEENVCGHATIAALRALSSLERLPEGELTLETKLGLQRARVQNGTAWLEYGDAKAREIDLEREDAAVALGLESDDLHEDLPILAATAGRAKLFVAVPSTTYLDVIEPDLDAIKALCLETDTTGIVAFTFPGRDGAFTDARHFSHQKSVVEDIATGNAHAALCAYLAHTKFFDDGARAFSGVQGYALGKPSRLELRCTVSGDAVSRVWVGGKAIRVER